MVNTRRSTSFSPANNPSYIPSRVPVVPSIVFKVKLENTMRRFNVEVNAYKPLYLDMEVLRAKIRIFFGIQPDAAFTMTYVDEDQDVVTLGSDDDLPDIVKQGLNPVRITVHPTDNKYGSWVVVTPSVHSANRSPGRNINSAVALDVPSKAANPPALARPVNSQSKLGKTSLTTEATNETSQEVAASPSAEGDRDILKTRPRAAVLESEEAIRDGKKARANFTNNTTALRGPSCSENSVTRYYVDTSGYIPRFERIKKWKDINAGSAKKPGSESDPSKLPRQIATTRTVPGSCNLRLNSRFVTDVSVHDGTLMAPETPFIKIWRVRNNGNDPWPTGTRLVWLDGAKLSDVNSVDLKLPHEGLAVDAELQVAVECTAPKSPGQYRSNWRLESPHGQLFGVFLWVEIEVDSSLTESEEHSGLDLNSPPACEDNQPVKIEPTVAPLVHEPKPKIDDLNLPVGPSTGGSSSVTDPISSKDLPCISFQVPPSDSMVNSSLSPAAGSTPATCSRSSSFEHLQPEYDEEALMKAVGSTLEELALHSDYAEAISSEESEGEGFTEVDSEGGFQSENPEVISSEESEGEEGFTEVDSRKEEIDFEEPTKDPSGCSDSEWDLVEMQSTGIPDNAMNEQVVEKKKGNFMRTVMGFVTKEF